MNNFLFAFILQASACSLYNNEVKQRDFRRRRTPNPDHTEKTAFTQPKPPPVTEPTIPDGGFSDAKFLFEGPNETTSSDTAGKYGAQAVANRYKLTTKLTTRKLRSTPALISQEEECDYLAFYCKKGYKTGKICGRTVYFQYKTFVNYCQLDYINCMERYEVWQIAHMGACFIAKPLKDYQHYEYHDDLFLDQIYVIQE